MNINIVLTYRRKKDLRPQEKIISGDRRIIFIGSGADCDLILDSKGVEPRHLQIQIYGEHFVLVPMAARGEIALNGQVVKKPTLFRNQDVISVADARIELRTERVDEKPGVKAKKIVVDMPPVPPEPMAAAAPRKSGRGTLTKIVWFVLLLLGIDFFNPFLPDNVNPLRFYGFSEKEQPQSSVQDKEDEEEDEEETPAAQEKPKEPEPAPAKTDSAAAQSGAATGAPAEAPAGQAEAAASGVVQNAPAPAAEPSGFVSVPTNAQGDAAAVTPAPAEGQVQPVVESEQAAAKPAFIARALPVAEAGTDSAAVPKAVPVGGETPPPESPAFVVAAEPSQDVAATAAQEEKKAPGETPQDMDAAPAQAPPQAAETQTQEPAKPQEEAPASGQQPETAAEPEKEPRETPSALPAEQTSSAPEEPEQAPSAPIASPKLSGVDLVRSKYRQGDLSGAQADADALLAVQPGDARLASLKKHMARMQILWVRFRAASAKPGQALVTGRRITAFEKDTENYFRRQAEAKIAALMEQPDVLAEECYQDGLKAMAADDLIGAYVSFRAALSIRPGDKRAAEKLRTVEFMARSRKVSLKQASEALESDKDERAPKVRERLLKKKPS